MTELAAVKSLVLEAAARDPELGRQLEAMGKSVLLTLCELAVQDPEPNASRVHQLQLGQKLPVEAEAVKNVFETVVLARLALQIVKASLPDAARLEGQLAAERKKRSLAGATDNYLRALASAAVNRRGPDRQISP